MSEIGANIAVEMIRAVSNRLAEVSDELSRLDGVAGDGDHGVNVSTAFADAVTQIAGRDPDSAAEVFLLVSKAFNGGGGGAAAALFGALFSVLGNHLDSAPVQDVRAFVDGLDLALSRLKEIGRAEPGDKTMLDALQPAIDAARPALGAGGSLGTVLAAAATAAARGAARTAEMEARAGRARYGDDGGIGTRDPGAVTVAVIFEAWATTLNATATSDSAARLRTSTRDETSIAPPKPQRGPAGDASAATPEGRHSAKLDKLATQNGRFAILALDHVRSFATTMRPDHPDSLTPKEMNETKAQLVRNLAKRASAVLIDPAFTPSWNRALPLGADVALIIGIEDGDYETATTNPRLLPEWTVERAANAGADAVKISFSFDPDQDTSAAERFVKDTVRQCELVGLPLLCEPLAPVRQRNEVRRNVLEGVRRFGSLGASILKIQFPCGTHGNESRDSWAEACAEADALSTAPWVLLSEGRDFVEFRELLTIACQAGASGFVAGRAIWGGVDADRNPIATSAARLEELRAIAITEGSPWNRR